MRIIAVFLLLATSAYAGPAINPTDTPIYWMSKINGNVNNYGVIDVNSILYSSNEIVQSDTENGFMAEIASDAADFDPLPDSGWLKQGEIYNYQGTAVMVRQSHNRTEHAPADVPALFTIYRENEDYLDWIAGEPVEVGMLRIYNETTYRCIQAHVTQEDWTPPSVPALWAEVVEQTGEWAIGVAYEIDDEVTYSGSTYICIQAHTSQAGWTPPVVPALWNLVE